MKSTSTVMWVTLMVFLFVTPVFAQMESGVYLQKNVYKTGDFITAAEIVKDPSKVSFTINFETNKANVLKAYEPQLDEIGKAMQSLAKHSFEISGHTDQRGSEIANMRLSEKRAESVRQYLIKKFNIQPDRLISRGFGKSELIDTANNEKAWSKNRRVELASLGKMAAEPLLTINSGGHTSSIKGLVFTPDGQNLISAGTDKSIRVWNIKTGKMSRIILGNKGNGDEGQIFAIDISPNGKLIGVGGIFAEEHSVNNNMVGGIRLYDFASGKLLKILSGHESMIKSIKFSPDGKLMASGSTDKSIRIWDVASSKLNRVLKGHEGSVDSIDFSHDSTCLATASNDRTFRVWDITNGKELYVVKEHNGDIRSVVWDPQNRFIATSNIDRTVRLWEASTGKLVNTIGEFGNNRPSQLSFSKDGNRILIGEDGFRPIHGRIYSIPDGKLLMDNTEHLDAIQVVAFSPDGTIAATGGGSNNEIRLLNTDTGKMNSILEGGGGALLSIGVSDDGTQVGYGYADPCPDDFGCPDNFGKLSNALITQQSEGNQHIASGGDVTNESIYKRALLSAGGYSVKREKDASGTYGIIRLYKDGVEQHHIVKNTNFYAYTFIKDGKYLAVAHSNGIDILRTPDLKYIAELRGHEEAVFAIVPSKDGNLLYSASYDQTIRVWNVEQIPEIDFNIIDEGTVAELITSAKQTGITYNRKDALEYMNNFNIPAYKFPKWTPIVSIFPARNGEWVAWTKSGYYAASLKGDKLIGWHMNRGFYRAADWYGADQFASMYYRPEIVAKTLEYRSEEAAIKAVGSKQANAKSVDVVKHAPPLVQILSPSDRTTTKEKEITINFEIEKQNDDRLQNVLILLNGRQVKNTRGLKVVSKNKDEEGLEPRLMKQSVKIPLSPGQNVIQIVAETAYSRSNPEGITIEHTQSQPQSQSTKVAKQLKPRLYVLSMGVSKYANADYNLNYAHRDAEVFAKVAKDQEGGLFSEVNTKILTNEQATRKNILKSFKWLNEMSQDDLAIVLFAGHGQKTDDNRLYLMGYDAEEEDLLVTGVKFSEIQDMLKSLPGKVIFMADACHSGAATREKKYGRRATGGFWNTDELAREFSSIESGLILFMATQSREFSLEDAKWGGGHGAFAHSVIEGIRGAADLDNDGTIYLSELQTYVKRNVPKLTKTQHPTTSTPETMGDFPIAVKR